VLGVPWPAMNQHEVRDKVETQAQEIARSLVESKVTCPASRTSRETRCATTSRKPQVVALIAYIQKLGAYREVIPEHKPIPLDPDSKPLGPDSLRHVEAKNSTPPRHVQTRFRRRLGTYRSHHLILHLRIVFVA
jgi:cytochrome c oxidase cbb3-type subunit I/II